VTAIRQVAGANLAYRSFISFPESLYSLISSPFIPLLVPSFIPPQSRHFTATYSTTQIGFDFFHYIL
jgi:hypothetical protein